MKRRGFTLLEQIAACALFSLVMTLSWQVLSPNLRLWQRERGRAEIEQNSLVVATRLAAELRASNADSVTCLADPPGFSFAAAPGYDPDSGRPVWSGAVAYSLDTENHVLYRMESSADKGLLSAAGLQRLLTSDNQTERAVATYVYALTVTRPVDGLIHVSLRCGWPDEGTVAWLERTVDVRMRNPPR
jgi:hypothetical protein